MKRAFALPMVLMLMLAGTLGIVVILDRQVAHTLAVQRQLDDYRIHHAVRGLEESLSAWLNTLGSLSVTDLVAADPHLLDLPLAGGTTISISMRDGQGTVLADFSGLKGDEPQTAQELYDRLLEIVGEVGMPEMTRTKGPVTLSVNGAPDEVIEAACVYITGGDKADRLAKELLGSRAREPLTSAKMATIAGEFGLSPEERAKLNQVLTDKPVIWEMEVLEVAPATVTQPERVLSVYDAGVQFNGTRAAILWFTPRPIELGP